MRAISTAFRSISERFNDWRARERAYAELSALDDRTLADLGLRRSDIPLVVYAKAREPIAPAKTAPARIPANSNGGRRAA